MVLCKLNRFSKVFHKNSYMGSYSFQKKKSGTGEGYMTRFLTLFYTTLNLHQTL